MTEFDVHEIRSDLKLLSDSGASALYDNRGGATCPVCGDEFDEVLVTSESSRRIEPGEPLSFCLLNERDRVIVLTHT